MAIRKKTGHEKSATIPKRRTAAARSPTRPAGPAGRREGRRSATPEPEWISTLRTRWRATNPANQQMAVRHVRHARARDDAEGRLCHLQQAFRALNISEQRIVRLLCQQHLILVAARCADPLKQLASRFCVTLESFEPKRPRRKRPQRRHGKGDVG